MSRQAIREYFKTIYHRYHQASQAIKHLILDECCANTGYHRKYAIRKLNGPPPKGPTASRKRKRDSLYSPQALSILAAVWEAAGYPCSVRLKALLVRWLPWIRKRFHLTPLLERQLLSISARQIDRRLKDKKAHIRKRLYGRTKPGALLKHRIPIKTDHWDVQTPGFTEVDTVAHCGNRAEGEFGYTVNQTDILTTWVESRAVLGKAEIGVVNALDEMAQAFPFSLQGIDSDNGSEFINYHLLRYSRQREIQLTRGRPYKKDDNAHIEQKNWTHVRKLLGWDRYDTPQAIEAINELYQNALRLFMNLFMPSMKLLRKERIGSRLKRIYEEPQTPFERVLASDQGDPVKVAELKRLRDSLDPFELAQGIEKKLDRIFQLAHHHRSPIASRTQSSISQDRPSEPLSRTERETVKILSEVFGIPVYVRNSKHPKKP